MANTNCLKGWKCPRCTQSMVFHVLAIHTVILTDDGTEPLDGSESYTDDSPVDCPVCEWHGLVREVRL